MGYWNTRGLRGSTFEEMINLTNNIYMQKGLAVVQKVPTPITPVKLDNATRTITLAYFGSKSTIDYIGAAQGIPICFDAKETTRKSLPIQNIHKHQIEFMDSFEKQNGLAFLLVHFLMYDQVFMLPFGKLKGYWDAAQGGGSKSIAYEKFDADLLVVNKNGCPIHYLEAINTYLQSVEGGE